MAQPRPWLVFLAGLATSLALSGCSTTEWIPVRYAAPISPSYEATLATNLCAQRCYHGHRKYFFACLAECPGIVVESGATCEEPREAPEAFCYTEEVPEYVEGAGDQIAQSFFEGVFEAFVDGLTNGLVNAAVSSGHGDHDDHGDHGHGHSGRSHEASHSEHREARRSESHSRSSRDESTRPRHRAASPRVQ